jgi:hypothetical protein
MSSIFMGRCDGNVSLEISLLNINSSIYFSKQLFTDEFLTMEVGR